MNEVAIFMILVMQMNGGSANFCLEPQALGPFEAVAFGDVAQSNNPNAPSRCGWVASHRIQRIYLLTAQNHCSFIVGSDSASKQHRFHTHFDLLLPPLSQSASKNLPVRFHSELSHLHA